MNTYLYRVSHYFFQGDTPLPFSPRFRDLRAVHAEVLERYQQEWFDATRFMSCHDCGHIDDAMRNLLEADPPSLAQIEFGEWSGDEDMATLVLELPTFSEVSFQRVFRHSAATEQSSTASFSHPAMVVTAPSTDHSTVFALATQLVAVTNRGGPVYLHLLSCLQISSLAAIGQAILRDAQDDDLRQIGLLLLAVDYSPLRGAVGWVIGQRQAELGTIAADQVLREIAQELITWDACGAAVALQQARAVPTWGRKIAEACTAERLACADDPFLATVGARLAAAGIRRVA